MRRQHVTAVATAALILTFAVVAGFDWTPTLGALAFAPLVGLIGFGAGTAVARRRLRESEHAHESTSALQSALIDSTLDGISLTDADGNILIMNKPIMKMAMDLGMPLDGTVPERLLAITDRVTEPERYRRRMLELASSPTEPASDEFELEESGRVFRGYAAPVSSRGRFVGRIWTLREVTADRELDRMRDAFIAAVSHELRTPLTTIAGFVEMMLHGETESLSENARSYLRAIARSSDRLQHLVEELLLMAQIEARKLELNWQPTDLGLLAQQAVESARPAAQAKDIRIDLDIDHAREIRADRERVAQVIDNLISNAVKFTTSGGSVTVAVGGDENAARRP